jgi:hypothetical protein
MDVALQHFGVAHATTTLARGNLVDALDQLGDREAARQLLADSIEAIKKVRLLYNSVNLSLNFVVICHVLQDVLISG